MLYPFYPVLVGWIDTFPSSRSFTSTEDLHSDSTKELNRRRSIVTEFTGVSVQSIVDCRLTVIWSRIFTRSFPGSLARLLLLPEEYRRVAELECSLIADCRSSADCEDTQSGAPVLLIVDLSTHCDRITLELDIYSEFPGQFSTIATVPEVFRSFI